MRTSENVRCFAVLAVVWIMIHAATVAAQVFSPSYAAVPWVSSSVPAKITDVNGNGLADVFYVSNAGPAAPFSLITVVYDQGLQMPPSIPPQPIVSAIGLSPTNSIAGIEVADFDADGRADVIFLTRANGANPRSLWYLPGTPGGGFQSTPILVHTAVIENLVFGDFNADGVKDCMIHEAPSSTGPWSIELYLGSAAGLSVSDFSIPTSTFGFGDMVALDQNGDGATDLTYFADFGTIYTFFGVSAASGAPFALAITQPIAMSSAFNRYLVGDFDADGYEDFLTLPTNASWFRGSASGVLTGPLPLGGTVISPNFAISDFAFGDIDGDGAKECLISVVGFLPNQFYVTAGRVAPGSVLAFTDLQANPFTYPSIPNPNILADAVRFGDLDGDDDPDLLAIEHDGFLSGVHVVENLSHFGAGCPGTFGIPELSHTAALIGAPAFSIGLRNAAPNALAALLLSFVPTPQVACGFNVSLSPSDWILPGGQVPFFATSPVGEAAFVTAVPNVPALSGIEIFAQWAVVDPQGAFAVSNIGVALSSGAALRFL